MAKAHSPVRLESSLMESAAIAGEAFKRSAAEQVEFWASIGRLVAPRITPNEIIELHAGLISLTVEKSPSVSIDSKALLKEIDQQRESGHLQKAIANGQVRYQASLTHPGYLEQVSPDGRLVVGQFNNGEFTPL